MAKKESPLLGQFYAKTKELHPDRIHDGGSADESINAGVPIPYLSLMYLLNSTVLSLSKAIGLAGPAMSQKSSLGYEFIRLVQRYSGAGVLIDSEGNKFNPSLIRSIMGDAAYDDRNKFNILTALDSDESLRHMTGFMKWVRESEIQRTPLALVLDSLYGTATEGMVEKQDREGVLQADFARVAQFWTRNMQAFIPQLVGWPVLFVFTNHLKDIPSVMPGGPPGKTTPGGVAQRFYASNYLHMRRVERRQAKTAEEDGDAVRKIQEIRTIELKLNKTSLGIDARKVNVDFVWWYRDDTDRKQVTQWDWDSATAYLLLEEQGNADNTGKALRGVVDVRMDKKRFSSSVLKLKDVPAHELGAAVHADRALIDALVSFMHIQRNPVWPGLRLTDAPQAKAEEKQPEEKPAEKPAKADKPPPKAPNGLDMG